MSYLNVVEGNSAQTLLILEIEVILFGRHGSTVLLLALR